jgi:hypothetical protein
MDADVPARDLTRSVLVASACAALGLVAVIGVWGGVSESEEHVAAYSEPAADLWDRLPADDLLRMRAGRLHVPEEPVTAVGTENWERVSRADADVVIYVARAK